MARPAAPRLRADNLSALQQKTQQLTALHTETQKHLSELLTINAISQAAAAHLELEALLNLVGDRIQSLFGAHAVYVALLDRQANLISIPYYRYREERLEGKILKPGEGLTSKIIELRQPILINRNFTDESAKLGLVPIIGKRDGTFAKSWLGVPIFVGEDVIGVISVQNFAREEAFTEDDVRLLRTVAANIGIAFQNAQLYTAAQRRLTELQIVNAISQAAARNLEQQALFDFIDHQLIKTFDIQALFTALYEDETGHIHIPYWRYYDRRIEPAEHKPLQGLVGKIFETQKPLLIDNNYEERSAALGVVRVLVDNTVHYPKTWLGVPLLVGESAIGVISVQNFIREYAFSPDDVNLLNTIAANLGIAVRNAQLYEQSQRELIDRRQAQAELHQVNEQLQTQLAEVKVLQAQCVNKPSATRSPIYTIAASWKKHSNGNCRAPSATSFR